VAVEKVEVILNAMEMTNIPFQSKHWLTCTIIGPEPGGYFVSIKDSAIQGFLESTKSFEIGDILTAKFIRMDQARAFLILGSKIHGDRDESTEEKSEERRLFLGIDEAIFNQPGESNAERQESIDEQKQFKPVDRFRRASDLILPPPDENCINSLKRFRVTEYDLEWLLLDIEGGMRTGVLKTSSQSKLSRAAFLLYRGRLVGCVYGRRANPDAKATEESATLALADMESPDTMVTIYDLPAAVVLAMSALFLGHTIEKEDNMDSRTYFNSAMNSLEQNQSTACIVITIPSKTSTHLVFLGQGKFGGAFCIEDQQFSKSHDTLEKLFGSNSDAQVEVSFLSSEATAMAKGFGYSLTKLRKRPPNLEAS